MNIIRKARVSADKRSIDAYGRSIELAIADYLLDKGEFPTSIEELTIEYSGDKVECTTAQLNSDSSVYLSECTVGGRSVDYTYGKDNTPTYKTYKVGDEVTYNNVDYYVIKDSSKSESTVTLLKSEPLTYEEVQTYSNGTGAQTSDNNGYGGMQYYSSETCWNGDTSGCTTNYASSQIKYVVDAWKNSNADSALEARLIQYDEFENLGFVEGYINPSDIGLIKSDNTPSWVYNSNYTYWTSSQYNDYKFLVWGVDRVGKLIDVNIHNRNDIVVRPVIVLDKSVLN